MKISLCMIVKDEEKNIVNCLDRALKLVDEAIIVDTGSQDRTKDIIRESYGKDLRVKLIEYPWENDFSKARNQSIKHATGDWILVLDADERIFADRQKLEEYIENKSNKTYIIPIYNIMSKDDITITSSMIRFYKNENPRYEGAIHEQIFINGQKSLGEVVDGNICRIYHYGYTQSFFEEKDKENRNMDIIMEQIEREPNDPFHWYNKGVMEMAKGNNERAIDDFIKSHHLTNKTRTSYHNDLVFRIIQCMLILKKYKEAIEFIKTVYKDPLIGAIPDLYYYWGIAYANGKKYSLAIKNFKKAIEIGEYEQGISKFGSGSFLPKIEWAKVLLLEKNTDLSIEKFKDAVLDPHNIRYQGLNELKHLLQRENRVEELEELENAINKRENNNNATISNEEFEKYKKEVKGNIEKFIEKGMLQESKELVNAYEKIIKNDVDIHSFKGIIAMMESDMARAEKFFLKGIAIDEGNFDLLYNLAYVYQANAQDKLAIKYYKKALQNAKTEKDENEIYRLLKELGSQESKEELAKNKMPKTSIVILTYNNLKFNKMCIESIRNYTKKGSYEIIVVDNYSTDGTVEWLKQQNDLKLILNDENLGFPKGCNQGIEIADSSNDILLLNNDTIVTPNWLTNLKTCLYSNDTIGAVGPVTNACSYYQAISVKYKTINEMFEFAKKFNILDSNKWEQRVKLVGYCMLIKRKVINTVGLLDEKFSPGNFEDDDLSFRIQNAGCKLMLCNDTFIHHFGSISFNERPESYHKLLEKNSLKFKEKWGFDSTYSTFMRNEIIELIDVEKDKKINVLEVGCACGATLLKIKHLFKNANLYGIELNKSSARIAENFADIRVENIENTTLSYDEKHFDYIILADVLEHLYDPWKTLKTLKRYLKTDGKILASIPNVMHHSVIKQILNGHWRYQNSGILDRTHIRFFTLKEIEEMFAKCGYSEMIYLSNQLPMNEEDMEFVNTLSTISKKSLRDQYKTYQYIIKATNSEEKMQEIFF